MPEPLPSVPRKTGKPYPSKATAKNGGQPVSRSHIHLPIPQVFDIERPIKKIRKRRNWTCSSAGWRVQSSRS